MKKYILCGLVILFSLLTSSIINADTSLIINPISQPRLVEEDIFTNKMTNVINTSDIIKEKIETYEKEDNKETYIVNVTEEDELLLSQIIEAEAKGEPYNGKIAVGNVVLNRVQSPLFPNTIKEVIYAPNQFSPVKNGAINNTPSEDSKKAAKEALYGHIQPESKDALYFWASYVNKNNWIWTRELTGQIGNHCFGK